MRYSRVYGYTSLHYSLHYGYTSPALLLHYGWVTLRLSYFSAGGLP